MTLVSLLICGVYGIFGHVSKEDGRRVIGVEAHLTVTTLRTVMRVCYRATVGADVMRCWAFGIFRHTLK